MSADSRGPSRRLEATPLRHAWKPDYRPRPELERVSLTTLHVTERCAGCCWPRVCGMDETCWRLERTMPWTRSRLTLEEDE